ncbi:MAG TPA: hypothetical protein VNX28_11785 [Gemmataceae bacterium]|jgi:hypothetical protein|nr:hypothetical protein [Gemmataceae bacterium]
MAPTTLETPGKSLAEVLHDLGDISPDRVGMPVGTATEQDVINALEAANKRLYELIDGVLVEKDMGKVLPGFSLPLKKLFAKARRGGAKR